MSRDLAALQSSPREVARWQQTQQQLMGRQTAPALAGYRDLVRKFDAVAQLWFELGIAAMGELEFDLADDAFRRAMELSTKDVQMLILLAQQYQRLRRLDRVRACFERAVAANPASAHAQISLALWHEKDRQLDKAWECVTAGLAANPRDGYAGYVKALLLHRQGRDAEAEPLLRDLLARDGPEPRVRISCRYLLAEILDEAGEYAEAFRQLLEAKNLQRQTANLAKLERDYDRADANRRKLLAALTPGIVQRWRQEIPPATTPVRLAFLGGHPRSGTTLLEQVLGAHPHIRAFDEPDAFVNEIWNPLAPMSATQALTLNQLNALSAHRRAEMRRRYLKSLLREAATGPDAKILLDKNPSPTMALCLWLRIFPDLKVIIALRDPRDVLVSCLFQNLELTPLNANFLSVARAARHYADLMDAWLRLRELGGFDWIEVHYQNLVANLESEGRRATEFLGLPWHAQQASFHESARRKFFFAPTYQDVTQPVHPRSVGRWKNYAMALAPVQERLAFYCRAFGFEERLG
jgi:tetratricopeptide (TPR) repeat protein